MRLRSARIWAVDGASRSPDANTPASSWLESITIREREKKRRGQCVCVSVCVCVCVCVCVDCDIRTLQTDEHTDGQSHITSRQIKQAKSVIQSSQTKSLGTDEQSCQVSMMRMNSQAKSQVKSMWCVRWTVKFVQVMSVIIKSSPVKSSLLWSSQVISLTSGIHDIIDSRSSSSSSSYLHITKDN